MDAYWVDRYCASGKDAQLFCRRKAGGVFAVFFDFNSDNPGAVLGCFADHDIKNAVEMLSQALAGAVGKE